jgi:hypothetical protein
MDLLAMAITGVAIAQANEPNILKMEKEIEGHKKDIEHLTHQVEY